MKLTDSIPAPDYVDVVVLGVATAESYTIPTGARYIVFSAENPLAVSAAGAVDVTNEYQNDFYVRKGGTAAIPAADVSDGTGSFLNPKSLNVMGVGTLSLISPAAIKITMAVYGSPEDEFKL